MQAGIDTHLGYLHSDRKTQAQDDLAYGSHQCKGPYSKAIKSDHCALEVTVPGIVQERSVPSWCRSAHADLDECDDMIISPYAGGMAVREIQRHFASNFGIDTNPDAICTITDATLDEVMLWHNRQSDEFYLVAFLIMYQIKIR